MSLNWKMYYIFQFNDMGSNKEAFLPGCGSRFPQQKWVAPFDSGRGEELITVESDGRAEKNLFGGFDFGGSMGGSDGDSDDGEGLSIVVRTALHIFVSAAADRLGTGTSSGNRDDDCAGAASSTSSTGSGATAGGSIQQSGEKVIGK